MYGNRSNGKKHGDVFTSPAIVKYMLDLVGYTSDRDLSHVTVIEPSCGEGEFVLEIITRLAASARKFEFSCNDAINNCLQCFDIDKDKIDICLKKIKEFDSNLVISESLFRHGDFLLSEVHEADLIIGNPPYVRHEQIPEERKSRYKQLYSTFKCRADLFIPFFEKSLNLLNKGGKHCFICSNRWFRNQYGYYLRDLISSSFDLQKIVNLEKVHPFQEKVIAYPAVSLILNQPPGDVFEYTELEDLKDLYSIEKNCKLYTMPRDGNWGDVFNGIPQCLKLSSIEELGFKIGIGVATGADKIFIGSHLGEVVENELLLPILTSKDIKGNCLKWGGNYLINPFDDDGNVIDISKYAKAKAYMETHEEKLKSRHVAQKHPLNWFRTIDKVHKNLVAKPKLLLPDISANNRILIDAGHYYPHHNLYYITGNSIVELKILGALLMSDFVILQLSRLANSMNGGYPRWQSQYLRKLKIPNIHSIGEENLQALISSYDSNNIPGINAVVNDIIA